MIKLIIKDDTMWIHPIAFLNWLDLGLIDLTTFELSWDDLVLIIARRKK